MTTTDPAIAAATAADSAARTAALLASLCSQSATLSGVLARLPATTALIEPLVDGWHGPAEAAQSWLVARIAARIPDAAVPIRRAIDDTNAAIWAVSSGG